MKKYISVFFILIFIIIFPLVSQDNNVETTQGITNNYNNLYTNLYPVKPSIAKVEISGYRGIQIGMNMIDTIDMLKKDPLISIPAKYVRSEVDISSEASDAFLGINENKFYKSGYFLFKNNALYSMIIRFQPEQVDFLQILTVLNAKYGEGAFMDPNTVAWQNGTRQLILERPTTVKYSDTDVVKSVIINYTNLFVTNMNAILGGL